MSTNEGLRRLLNELGVEYRYEGVTEGTLFVVTRDVRIYYILAREKGFKVWSDWLTPEQAIAATLGSCNCSNNCTNGERTETCKADETDTIKCWVKCKDEPSSERMELIHVMECTECGHTYEHVNGDYEYCPRCGRKREDVSE